MLHFLLEVRAQLGPAKGTRGRFHFVLFLRNKFFNKGSPRSSSVTLETRDMWVESVDEGQEEVLLCQHFGLVSVGA